jgi:hypothetical protein
MMTFYVYVTSYSLSNSVKQNKFCLQLSKRETSMRPFEWASLVEGLTRAQINKKFQDR